MGLAIMLHLGHLEKQGKSMSQCPCGSQNSYLACCEPYLTDKQRPENPEALMRSRYSAYTMANISYIKSTMLDKALNGFDETNAERWARKVNWISLHIFNAVMENSKKGHVEFEASFVEGGRLKSLHEKSEFKLDKGRWYYIGGNRLPSSHSEKMISRNGPCPCESGRKFKNCHG